MVPILYTDENESQAARLYASYIEEVRRPKVNIGVSTIEYVP
jgi:hypothetical protein